jgi:hypothetical protein
MSFSRLIRLIATYLAVSAAALALATRFVPGFSVLGSSGWLIYLIGGAVVFLAFYRRSLSVKSRGSQEGRIDEAHSQASDADQNIEDVRTRIRAIKGQRSRSVEKDPD